jgi:hypothetical protein
MELNKEQKDFLDNQAKGRWTLNEKTGLVDIDGDFRYNDEGLKDFKGIRFGVVTGNFSLTSLKGAQLTSLEGAPQEVGGYFCCYNNKLTSLEGAPQVVGGYFDCRYNNLTSLEGAPQEVRGGFSCGFNNLTSLVGAPQEVGENFDCSSNKLTSLEGAPQKVGEGFYCDNNPISEETLELVWNTMLEKKIDYWTALLILKSRIDSEELVVMSKGIDSHISKDAQKGLSMLGRFGHFD